MTELTDEQKAAVEELAGLFFSPDEVQIIVFGDDDNSFEKAYQKGFLMAEFEHRKKLFNLAKGGSAPAQIQIQKLIDKAKWEQLQKQIHDPLN